MNPRGSSAPIAGPLTSLRPLRWGSPVAVRGVIISCRVGMRIEVTRHPALAKRPVLSRGATQTVRLIFSHYCVEDFWALLWTAGICLHAMAASTRRPWRGGMGRGGAHGLNGDLVADRGVAACGNRVAARCIGADSWRQTN